MAQKLNDVAWTGSRYIAVGGGGTLLTSSDGSGWTLQSIPVVTQPVLNGAASSPERAVVVGTQGAAGIDDLILTSTDGVNWTQAAATPDTVALYAVT